jgi:phosphatidylglycerophosphatase A
MPIDPKIENSRTPTPSTPGVPRWPLWLITLGGSGLLRPAPGTWGSLAATIALCVVHTFTTSFFWPFALLVGLLICSIINVAFGRWIEAYFGKEDPGPCVIDEGAGICLTLMGQPMLHPWLTFLLAFAAFRLFDIIKPPPARQLEELPRGWGILMDDLAAAIYANILCHLLLSALG